jgi:hypothetical protein
MDQNGVYIEDLNYQYFKKSDFEKECQVISKPSPEEFLRHVESNHPFIIRGYANDWPATEKWDLDYLEEKIRDNPVIFSIS